ncbi:radical SAM protein [Halobacteriovorax sp. HLS]|uniref:radical SAM protein n=1 Tax=Halobacteriovorax sp. HLS TaxID=2234000 RepID=UPI000FDC1F5E|nr:radical SAM protein [Halobacteriovorax sp. HLS]
MSFLNLSINPLYQCNFRCDFCYLTKSQLSDPLTLPLTKLRQLIKELKDSNHSVDHVDLYGGEISLLSNEYLEELDEILYEAFDPSINIVTNLYQVHPFFLKEHVSLSVSFDFEARESSEKVLQNIITTNKEISILMLASSKLLKMDVSKMISTFNSIGNVVSVEIKPYSTNQANSFEVSFKDFEEFVKKWIESDIVKNFEFVNEREIENSLSKKRNAFSDDHLYITPNGKFAVLEFDEKEDEYFLELDRLDDYKKWERLEHARVQRNEICSKCEYLGNCLTEHYRKVESLDLSCNGFFHLLDWYKNLK